MVPVKTVRCFWKQTRKTGNDPKEMRRARGELRDCKKETKDSYSRKIESKLQASDVWEVWKRMRTILACMSLLSRGAG